MKNIKFQKGQTLVILLVYMVIAIIVTTAAVALVLNSGLGTNSLYQGSNAYNIAESGVENAIIRLIRNPNYSGETLTVGDGQAVVSITGTGSAKTIVSRGTIHNHSRSVRVILDTTNSKITVNSWKEI